jgi:GT2 family glycosyltransferase
MSKPFEASVVVPTYQRRESLRRLLDVLTQQTLPASDFEVVVAVDGSTDGTREMLEELRPPYALCTAWHTPNRGRAAACNAGIRQSRGVVVVILDDDMEPVPGFLEGHLRAHAGQERLGVVGAVPIAYDETSPGVVRYIGAKFNQHLRKLAEPGTRIECRDFFSGNFSIRRSHLLAAGLFDESFTIYGNEDVDLGLRLGRMGVELVFSADALALQHYEKSAGALANDQIAKGRTAVLLASKHPQALPRLKLTAFHRKSRAWRLARAALLASTRLVPATDRAVVGYLDWLERRNRKALDACLPLALDYFFWVGAAAALREQKPGLGPARAVRELLAEAGAG